MNRFPRVQPLPRPSWWTAENVLEALRNGESAPAICIRAAAECQIPVKAVTLRADISKWANSATWGEQFTTALALYKSAGGDGGSTGLVFSKDWHDDFFAAMEQTNGVVPLACDLAGVGEGIVYALTDKRNKCYDADFTERFRIAEGSRMSKLRENVLSRAAEESMDGARLAASVLQNAMPTLHASRQQVDVQGKVDVEVEHRLAPEVVAAAQARYRALTTSRQRPALGSGDAPAIPAVARVVREAVETNGRG